MKESIETIIALGALLFGVITCLFVMWLAMREVRRGKASRLVATVAHFIAIPVLGGVPLAIALGARWLASLGDLTIFSRDGGNDGLLVMVGLMGMIVAVGAAVLFAAVMVVQAVTGRGSSE